MDLGSFWPGLAAATALGILSGLGIGGGSLLLLWLTLALGMDPEEARQISLLFFFPAALAGGLMRRTGLSYKVLLPAILWGGASAAFFTVLRRFLDPGPLRTAYGVLLLGIGVREIFCRSR